jgi:hypothetical protein
MNTDKNERSARLMSRRESGILIFVTISSPVEKRTMATGKTGKALRMATDEHG